MTLFTYLFRFLINTGLARLLPGVQRRLDGGADFLRYYSDRLLSSPLAELERLASAIDPVTADVIDLAAGSPNFDAVSYAPVRLPSDRRGWPAPAGLPELRGVVASKLLSENLLSFSPAEEVLITNGALGAAQTIFDAFANRSDTVVVLDPVSPLYPLLIKTRGANIARVQTRLDEGRLRIRFDQLSRVLRGARLLVINSPANPTGGIISVEDLEQIAWWADRHDVLILSDEVFDRYWYDEPPLSIATFPRARQRTLTVGSVSKSHALAWARVGWIAAFRHLLRPCLATAGLRGSFVSSLSQHVAMSALRTAPGTFAPIRQHLAARRQFAFDRLRAMGLQPCWPAGGFFLWLPVPSSYANGRAFAEILLTHKRVRVVPGDLFGPAGDGFVRLSLLADDGRLDAALERIGELTNSGAKNTRRRAIAA